MVFGWMFRTLVLPATRQCQRAFSALLRVPGSLG
jgi:hypothetical protein